MTQFFFSSPIPPPTPDPHVIPRSGAPHDIVVGMTKVCSEIGLVSDLTLVCAAQINVTHVRQLGHVRQHSVKVN